MWLLKNTIKNNHGCTTPWADFHPVPQSRSVWQPRSYPGPAGSKTQAGLTENLRKSWSLSSSSKTLIFPVCCFLSVRGNEVQPSHNPPSNALLLSNPILAEKALLQTWAEEEDWDDVTPKTCCLGWPSSKIPMSRCRSITAKTLVAVSAEERQHCTSWSSASAVFWST